MRRIPNFFIVGAPKCGTTALNEYLSQHPDVFIPTRKEIHHFGSDLVFSAPRLDREEYLALFDGWRDERRGGEASVWYLYSRNAAREIAELDPDARIVIMLRHPADMMYSLHSQRLYGGDEDIADFAEALAAEPARELGERVPRHCRNTMGLRYRDAARFTAQVRRYLDCFGRDRVHVILFDDLQHDVGAVYRRVCAFLGVDATLAPTFDVVNANKEARSRGLRDLLHFASPEVRTGIRAILPSARVRERLKRRLLSLNTRFIPRAPMDAALRARLVAEFLPEIESLGELLGLDLVERWCRPARRPPAPVDRLPKMAVTNGLA